MMNAPSLVLCGLHRVGTQVSSTIIPKRFRYYWDARPEGKHRKQLMIATLPRLKERKDVYVKQKQTEHKLYGLDVIFHTEAKEIFEKSRMVCAVMKSDMVFEEDYYRVQYQLRQHDMDIQTYPEHVMEFTLKGTRHERMMNLFRGSASCLVHGEPNVKQMLAALKPNIHLLLLGGRIDDKYYSVKTLGEYAALPSLDVARAQLSASLAAGARSTHDLLRRPTSALSSALRSHATRTSEESAA